VSEQPEIDRASDIMRARFLSGCQRVSTDLAWIEGHADEIRADVRGFLTDAAKKIEVAQERLSAQLDRLPTAQWERFKAMLTLLRAQQDVLDSVGALMQRARVNAVPRKIPEPAERPEIREITSAVAGPVRGRQPSAAWRTRSVIWGVTSVRLTVVTMIAAGLVFAYMMIPHESKWQEAKPVASATGAADGRIAERVSVRVDPEAVVPDPTTAQTAVDAQPTTPSPSPIAPGSAGFVPVVFTDMDKVKVLRAFSELQSRFPKLFGQRRAEAQPVDLGSKGLWHRLVVLPPGSHRSALEFCDQLLAAGYDRCWVKDY
jgi:hypothetical protein